ncbi:twin-arginine translocase subunit TatC [Pilimelia columellifera]|uniref:Sec-independent protein translocase protein TatC n=1 Tax=Pilimelia columellifera subsp. columellifera TaxID=706583 RepID=A0ABN3NL35_9ACTN
MPLRLRRRKPVGFARAADGSMTLIEHLRELRNRLFKSAVAIVLGFFVGLYLADPVLTIIRQPYCDLPSSIIDGQCAMVMLGPADVLLLKLKLALWLGLIIAGPVWLYQLWAFIAPGLHRHERRYAYVFSGIAAPLFAAGSILAYFVVAKGLAFLLEFAGDDIRTTLEITRYVDFVINLILIFGVAFEFPLMAFMLNAVGLVSAKKLMSWWRGVVFGFFAFAAVVTPTPDPFGMTALALCLSALYFIAVGAAFLNDRRRARRAGMADDVSDDEISPLAEAPAPVELPTPVELSQPVGGPPPLERPSPIPAPAPLASRYDETT